MEELCDIFELLDEAKKKGLSERTIHSRINYFLDHKARESATPYYGHFELTPLCNLDCKMCYVHLSESQMRGRKLLTAEEWFSLFEQAIAAGMARASLSGGECLTYPQFDEVFLFLKKKGVLTNIITNGVLLDEKRIDFFKRNPPNGIQITLYGNSEEAYERVTGKRAFKRVLENIQAAKDAGLHVAIMITPSKYMADSVKETVRLGLSLEVPCTINSGLMIPRSGTGREQGEHDLSVDDYIKILQYKCMLKGEIPAPQKTVPMMTGRETECMASGLRCAAGRSFFSISWDGLMHPCVQMESVYSNPLAEGFTNAWKRINTEVTNFPSFKKCADCPYPYACSFCAAQNEKMGSRKQLDPFWCERTWKMIENGLQPAERPCDST